MKLFGYVVIRVGLALFTILCVSLVVFIAMRMLPGGFEMMILGPIQTEEARAIITTKFGLDRPLPVQFFSWLIAVAQGDFGNSMITQSSVSDELLRRAPATMQLALMAIGAAILVGLPLGIAAGVGDRSRKTKLFARLLGAIGASTPEFVLGTVLLYVFSVWSLGATIGGYVPFFEDPVTNLRAMVLPAFTLSVFGVALILRTSRDSVLNVMTGGHITTAVARGETPQQVIGRQVLRNASLPVLTVTTMYFSALIGGAVIVETLFSVPGVGLYTWNALHNRDYVVTQSAVLIFSAIFVTFNMLIDIAYVMIDPRIRSQLD